MGLFKDALAKPIERWLLNAGPTREFPLSNFERIRTELRPCDVILIEGRSRVADVIRSVTQSPWTHSVIYVGRLHDIEDPARREMLRDHGDFEPNEQLIIESQLGSGTIARPLTIYRDEHLRICRPHGLNYQDGQEVIAYAIERLGHGYDVRHIFDLLRFMLPWSVLPRRWRSSLFQRHARETTRTVCSTMIAEAFGSVQFPILPLIKRTEDDGVQLFQRNPRLVTPSDFDYSPYFEIIKYPFLDFDPHTRYRLLPWSGKGMLDAAEEQEYVSPEEEAPAEEEAPQSDQESLRGEQEASQSEETASERDEEPPRTDASNNPNE